MRKIEQQMNDAVKGMRRWVGSNTMVGCYRSNDGKTLCSEIYLHGNHIATFDHLTQNLKVNLYTLRKWPSMTTRSRLRALGADLVRIKGVLHLNGKSIYAE